MSSNDIQPEVASPRPLSISYSACELDRKSDISDVSSSVRRSSYVTAAESSDLLFLMKTISPPQPDSDFTSGYTTQESGDFLDSIYGGTGTGNRSSLLSSLESPVLGRWTSTGSLSLANTLSRDLDLVLLYIPRRYIGTGHWLTEGGLQHG